MASLSGILAVATGALAAEQGALSATANNVANVNTPGYAREQPQLVESDPVTIGPVSFGTGVTLEKLQSIRDPILQVRIQQETQQQGQLNASVGALQQVQSGFATSTGDIGSQISAFFSSLDQLSTAPASVPDRLAVLTAAGNLASTFNHTADALTQQRSSLDLNVTQSVQQVNVLTGQIAGLSTRISELLGTGQDASAFVSQRDVLIGRLSSLINVSQIQTENSGLTLVTANGVPLVAGGQSYQLNTQTNAAGYQDVFAQGQDITSQISSGQLAGFLQVRDQTIPSVLTSLDTLAAGLANGINTANQGGFDLNGNAGGNIFAPPGATGAAANLQVQITDPALIAASSDGSAGSNGNVAALSAVANQPVAGRTPTDFYSGIVFNVGNDVANGTAELNSAQLVLTQLQDQRGSISGVSLNEEAANTLQYQEAYDAAAKVVTTIDNLLSTVINMVTTP